MKKIKFYMLLSLLVLSPLLAQEDDSAESTGKKPRTGYKAIKAEALPRDENGQLKAEVWDIVKKEAAANPGSNEARVLAKREEFKAFYARYADWKPMEPSPLPPGKLRNLSDTPKEPRFPLTDKVWPARPGEASVCLWEDDKLAAMSLGIDDNNAGDIPYWRELSKKYGGLNVTWNLIVSNIGGVVEKSGVGTAGTWETWQEMLKEGNHISSHSMMHNHDPVPADGWKGPEWETAEAKYLLETHLPGYKARTFVYPGAGVHVFGILGGYYPKSTWRPSIVKYYVAARGGGGNPISPANMIDYFDVYATTGNVKFILDNKDQKYADINLNTLFDPKTKTKNYRGWANVFIHFINNGKTFDTNPGTIAYGKVLAFYNEHRAELWTGFFDDVALYGQERDTATLVTNEADNSKIIFTLASKMDPAVFDYPLTVKVRLPDGWKGAAAEQSGSVIPVRVIEKEGAQYALVKAVPEHGRVTITPAAVK